MLGFAGSMVILQPAERRDRAGILLALGSASSSPASTIASRRAAQGAGDQDAGLPMRGRYARFSFTRRSSSGRRRRWPTCRCSS